MQHSPPLFHYSQPLVTSMESTCYDIFTKKRNPSDGFTSNICKSSAIHALGSSSNHVVKAADCEGTAGESRDITDKTLGGSFESKFIYPSLLKAILPHLSYLMRFSAGQGVFYGGMWTPQAARHSATVMVDRIA